MMGEDVLAAKMLVVHGETSLRWEGEVQCTFVAVLVSAIDHVAAFAGAAAPPLTSLGLQDWMQRALVAVVVPVADCIAGLDAVAERVLA